MTEISHFLGFDNTGWVHPDLGGWEEVPYWLRGYVDLGYVTGDAAALRRDRTAGSTAILATQQPTASSGPTALRTSLNGGPDFWPYMPMLQALRSWQEYTGDTRIVPFLTRFFRYMNAPGRRACSTPSWGAFRWGDTLDSVYWLYNRTGDAVPARPGRQDPRRLGANWVDNLPQPAQRQHRAGLPRAGRSTRCAPATPR